MSTVDKPVDKVEKSRKSKIFDQENCVFGLFAKQPIAGQVKTRLTPVLSPEQACELYKKALFETVYRFSSSNLPFVVFYDGDHGWFKEAFPECHLHPQRGEDLGARLTSALKTLSGYTVGFVALVGTDSPDLPLPLLKKAVAGLASHDVVAIPCTDGGFVAVGARESVPGLFLNIPWSTSSVLKALRKRCHGLRLRFDTTEHWYDLDEIADLKALVKRSPDTETAQYVSEHLEEFF